jgi:hypothetical protein
VVFTGGGMISLNKGMPVGFFFPTASGHHGILGSVIRIFQHPERWP